MTLRKAKQVAQSKLEEMAVEDDDEDLEEEDLSTAESSGTESEYELSMPDFTCPALCSYDFYSVIPRQKTHVKGTTPKTREDIRHSEAEIPSETARKRKEES